MLEHNGSRSDVSIFRIIFARLGKGCAKRRLLFGEQRIYASHHSIMFSRKTCYFFVRPKQKYLELCVFLGRRLKAPQVRRVDQASKSKLYHLLRITHRDEVEPPITDWLQEAYMLSKPGAAKSTPLGKQTEARKSKSAQQPEKVQREARPASKRHRKRSGVSRCTVPFMPPSAGT